MCVMSVMMSPKHERGLVLGASEIRQLQEAMNDPSFPNIKPNFSFTESEVVDELCHKSKI